LQFNLADLFERVADTVPERVSVVCAADRRTYAQLDERSTRLAHVLAAHGARPGTHVGLYMRNSIEHLEAMFACYKLRAVPINVNYRYVDDELAYLLADAVRAFWPAWDTEPNVELARAARAAAGTSDDPLFDQVLGIELGRQGAIGEAMQLFEAVEQRGVGDSAGAPSRTCASRQRANSSARSGSRSPSSHRSSPGSENTIRPTAARSTAPSGPITPAPKWSRTARLTTPRPYRLPTVSSLESVAAP